MPSDADRRLAATAARQHARFSLDDVRACGVPASTVYSRVERGLYVPCLPEVFAIAGAGDGERSHLMEAALYAGRDAVISHTSAARLLGYRYIPVQGGRHVIVPDRRSRSYRDVRVHDDRPLPSGHRMVVDGIPSTRWERTSCDMSSMIPGRVLQRFVSDVMRDGRTTADAIRRCIEEIGRFPGKRRLLAILDRLHPLVVHTRSELERLYLSVTNEGGVPPTAMNYPTSDVYGALRHIDAVYLPEGVPVELDSRHWHGLLSDHRADVRRENAIKLGGNWRDFLRFTWQDLTERPEQVVFEVREALRLARRDLRRQA